MKYTKWILAAGLLVLSFGLSSAKSVTIFPQETQLCQEDDFDCRDYVALLVWGHLSDDDIATLVENNKRVGYAKAMIDQKRMWIGVNIGPLALAEQRQYERLIRGGKEYNSAIIGDEYNLDLLEQFIMAGGFTGKGLGQVLSELSKAARKGEFSNPKRVMVFVKNIEKSYDKKTLPVIRLKNVDPFGPENEIHYGLLQLKAQLR